MSIATELRELEEMHKAGSLSDEEYTAAKAKVLSPMEMARDRIPSLSDYKPIAAFAGSYEGTCIEATIKPHPTHPHALVASGQWCGVCPFDGDEFLFNIELDGELMFSHACNFQSYVHEPGLAGIQKKSSWVAREQFGDANGNPSSMKYKMDLSVFSWGGKTLRRVTSAVSASASDEPVQQV